MSLVQFLVIIFEKEACKIKVRLKLRAFAIWENKTFELLINNYRVYIFTVLCAQRETKVGQQRSRPKGNEHEGS